MRDCGVSRYFPRLQLLFEQPHPLHTSRCSTYGVKGSFLSALETKNDLQDRHDGSVRLVAWSWQNRDSIYLDVGHGLIKNITTRSVYFFMSAEQFEKLSLAEAMVTTRAGTAKAAAAASASARIERSQNIDQDQALPSVELPVSPTPSLIISTNNLRYNVSAFDTNQRRRVKRGLEDNDIRMKYCAVSDDDEETTYFHLDDDITVAMGGNISTPMCTCGANEMGAACRVKFRLTLLSRIR